MATYGVFLRGVNVGGINIKMADLKKALGTLPIKSVRTVLASGNVVCTSAAGVTKLKAEIEACLAKSFGYEAWVVVLTADRLRELVEACPFPPDNDAVHSYVTLSSDPKALQELVDASEAAGAEQLRLGPEAMAWTSPKGGTLESPIGKISAKARFKSTTTTRNLRTLIKVLEAAAD